MSDHFSGPRALAGPQCDICDVYAFPSPERPGNLVLVMNVVPRATPTSCFSDAIVCRFRLRTAGIAADARAFTLGSREVVVDCTFDACRPTDDGAMAQAGRCTMPGSEAVAFRVNDPESGRGNRVRVFAGMRSEPFFLDFDAMQETLKTGRLAFNNPGTLTGPGANVLGLVVEIDGDLVRELGIGPLVTVVAETVADGKLAIRLERVGRPEVKNLLLGPRNHDPLNRDLELRDIYNLEDAYHVGPDYRNAYRARLNANLAFMDGFDGKIDWPLAAAGAHPLTDLILADFLVVDLSKPYAEDSFLEIERAMLAGREHQSCGGRSINDDIMDVLYTLTVNGWNGPRISDHVDQALKPATRTFPYLAAPNPWREVARPGTPVRPEHVHADGDVDHHHHAFGKYEL
jgi:uncharacterized protein DUF4331